MYNHKYKTDPYYTAITFVHHSSHKITKDIHLVAHKRHLMNSKNGSSKLEELPDAVEAVFDCLLEILEGLLMGSDCMAKESLLIS